MSTPVVMPQMGESIAEGTIVRWIKKVGDSVDRDEPLFEISTDKVDAEIPSPAAGVLLDIAVKEGETVPVNSVVATIGAAGETGGVAGRWPAAAPDPGRRDAGAGGGRRPARGARRRRTPPEVAGAGWQRTSAAVVAAGAAHRQGTRRGHRPDQRDRRRRPRDQARHPRAHGERLRLRPGSGRGDVGATGGAARPVPSSPGERVEIQPMSVMRKKIAEHMVLSKRTSAHVYSVFEVTYSRVEELRKARKADYERQGAKLTYTSFIAKAVVDTLRRHPVLNASIDGDNVVYKKDVNLGIAVALDNGLIVPVIKDAGEKNLLGLSRAIGDVADRARAKKLNPEEVQGGTFTITNPGTFGAQFGLPIINQPQVAILGVGTIEKRPVVIDDMIGIRLKGYLTLGYDHRLVDGAVADQFMADVKAYIEGFDDKQV